MDTNKIGIIGSETLSNKAKAAGLEVLTSDDFIKAVDLIFTESQHNPDLSVIVAGEDHPKLGNFLHHASGYVKILHITEQPVTDTVTSEKSLPVNKVFEFAGFDVPGDETVSPDGSISKPKSSAQWLEDLEEITEENNAEPPEKDNSDTTEESDFHPTPKDHGGEGSRTEQSNGKPLTEISPSPEAFSPTETPVISTSAPTTSVNVPTQESSLIVPEVDAMFSGNIPALRSRITQGTMILTVGANGGVGKTSNSIALAQRASRMGLKTLLIDGNRGQGDIRKYLRLQGGSLPTIFDLTFYASLDSVILSPEQINSVRGKASSGADPVGFHVLLAPLPTMADKTIVTSSVYWNAVEQSRTQFDLIVLDSQTYESFDNRGLEGLFIPVISDPQGWLVTVARHSRVSAENSLERIPELIKQGGSKDRTFLIVNNISPEDNITETELQQSYGHVSSHILATPTVPKLKGLMDHGATPDITPEFQKTTGEILETITGIPTVLDAATETVGVSSRKRFRDLFKALR